MDIKLKINNLFEDIFKPMDPDTVKEINQDLTKNWRINSIKVSVIEDEESFDAQTWYKTNKKRWEATGMKVYADYSVIEFRFYPEKRYDQAVQIVSDFLKEFREKIGTEGRTPTPEDYVNLQGKGGGWEDTGRIIRIEGDNVIIRFRKFGTKPVPANLLTYDKSDNTWLIKYLSKSVVRKMIDSWSQHEMKVGDKVTWGEAGSFGTMQVGYIESMSPDSVMLLYAKNEPRFSHELWKNKDNYREILKRGTAYERDRNKMIKKSETRKKLPIDKLAWDVDYKIWRYRGN